MCFQVEFSPSLAQLVNMVNDISSHLITSISVFRHLPEILTKRRLLRDPISVLVGKETSPALTRSLWGPCSSV